jgi:flagellar M-ring protein FliF
MEALLQTFQQFQQLLNGMAPSQRLTVIAVPLLILAGLAGLVMMKQPATEVAILSGTQYTADDLRTTEDALRQSGLTSFRTEGGRIYVKAADKAQYESAILLRNALPSQFGAELDKVHEKAGIFASDRQRAEMMQIARQNVLSRMIEQVAGVAKAKVMYEPGRQRSPFGPSKMKATVWIQMKPNATLNEGLAHSIRAAVAGSVHDLLPENVTVFDGRRTINAPDQEDAGKSRFLSEKERWIEQYRNQIEDALNYIPGINVAVNVELDVVRNSAEREVKYDTKPFAVRTTEDSETEKSDATQSVAEAGVKSNQPKDLRGQPGTRNTRNAERTSTQSENVPISTRVTETTRVGMTPRSVQASVSIPDDYLRQIAARTADEKDKPAFDRELAKVRQDTIKDVQGIVMTLIPVGSPVDSVKVTTHSPVETAPPLPGPGLFDRLNDVGGRWAGPVGLGLFAAWVLWMLNSSLKKLPVPEPPAGLAAALAPAKSSVMNEPIEEEKPKAPPTRRDQLQVLVRDNPEVAASVIGKWAASRKV